MSVERVERPGEEFYSPARKFGKLIRERMEKDSSFYLFSPDETTSNKLDETYEVSERAWGLPKREYDLPESEDGRIVEMLSENALFATMVGHVMNGEMAMMTSYEAFFPIILGQVAQQIKFFKQSEEVDFRPKYPAINLLSTSTCWRQDHNGFSHQSPLMISALLSIPSGKVNCLFPVDDVSAEECFKYMIKSENVVNFTTFDKNEEPRWIDSYHADFLFQNGGASIYRFCSDEEPDIILTAAGDISTRETIWAMKILREDASDIKMRFVGINALTYGAIGTTDKKFSQEQFDNYFTTDKDILANFHGYPETLKSILVNYADAKRITTLGFIEEGSTTTPLEMLRRNKASRYDIAIKVAEKFGKRELVKKYEKILENIHEHAVKHGEDIF